MNNEINSLQHNLQRAVFSYVLMILLEINKISGKCVKEFQLMRKGNGRNCLNKMPGGMFTKIYDINYIGQKIENHMKMP